MGNVTKQIREKLSQTPHCQLLKNRPTAEPADWFIVHLIRIPFAASQEVEDFLGCVFAENVAEKNKCKLT